MAKPGGLRSAPHHQAQARIGNAAWPACVARAEGFLLSFATLKLFPFVTESIKGLCTWVSLKPLMNRGERRAAAKASNTASDTTSDMLAALYQTGLRHFSSGRHLDAQLCCQQILATDAAHPETLHLMGLLSFHAKQYDHSVQWFLRAIAQEPKPEYLASLGTTLQQQGRYEEALKVLDKALQLKSDNAELWRQLGDILVQLTRFDEALLSFQHVLKLNARHPDALYKTGALLISSGGTPRLLRSSILATNCCRTMPRRCRLARGRSTT
jgi:tetratricopeptide (TPR) repeat protein